MMCVSWLRPGSGLATGGVKSKGAQGGLYGRSAPATQGLLNTVRKLLIVQF